MSISGKTGTVIKVLLVCGILSSLLYIGTDIIVAMSWDGYSYIDQAVSELTAIGAPTRSLVIPLYIVYDVLIIAFGIGVLGSAGKNRTLRFTGILLTTHGAFGLITQLSPMFSMSPREAEKTINDIMHLIVMGVIVLLILAYIGCGAAARGKWFRLYSIGTILTILVFGALGGLQGPQIAAGLPTPWFGVIERVSVYSPLLWVLVFAVVLLRAQGTVPQWSPADGTTGNLIPGELTVK